MSFSISNFTMMNTTNSGGYWDRDDDSGQYDSSSRTVVMKFTMPAGSYTCKNLSLGWYTQMPSPSSKSTGTIYFYVTSSDPTSNYVTASSTQNDATYSWSSQFLYYTTLSVSLTTSINLSPGSTYYLVVNATSALDWNKSGMSLLYTPTYKITYDGNGGIWTYDNSTSWSENVSYGTDYLTHENWYTRAGYTFDGWNEKRDGTGISWTGDIGNYWTWTRAGDVTLYAQWKVIEYDIKYYSVQPGYQGWTWYRITDVATTAYKLPDPYFAGWTFDGWTGSNGSTPQKNVTIPVNSTGDKSYTANWTANTYYVSYDGNGSTSGSMSNSTHTYDTAKTLTANSYERKYTVTYNHNYSGSTNASRIATYTFSKWNTNSNGTGTSYDNSASVINLATSGTVTLYAQWISASVNYSPTRTGYTFGGWYTNANCTGSATAHPYTPTPTSAKTFYAKWTANTYTVSYNKNDNGATGSTASSKHTYDSWKSLTANGFTKKGHTFAGWATSPSGPVVYSNTQSVKNLSSANNGTVTLYAKWTPNTYTITYYGNGGTDSYTGLEYWQDNPVTFGKPYTTYSNRRANGTDWYVRAGYTFTGWKDQNGIYWTEDIGIPWMWSYDYNVTLRALWEANTDTRYTVKHWKQDVGSTNYTLAATETKTGTTDSNTSASAKSYAGFTAQTFSQSTISGNGTTVVNIYYTRNSYTLTLSKGTGINSVSGGGANKQYGATISISSTNKTGYSFQKWESNVSGVTVPTTNSGSITMPASNLTLTASATANKNTTYTVRHWKQNLNATSTPQNSTNYTEITNDRQTLNGTTDTQVTPSVKSYAGFTPPATQTVTIGGAGHTVVDYYYTRNSYTVVLNKGTGVESVTGAGTYKYEESVSVTASMLTGYTWSRWSGSKSSNDISFTFTMPASNVTLTANSTANGYTITYVGQNGKQSAGAPVPGSTSSIVDSATYNADYNVREESNAFTRTGYKFLGWATEAGSKDISVWEPGDTVTWRLTDDLTLYAIWKSKGVLYVDNGSAFIPYTIWIDSGSTTGGPNNNGWYQYTAWLDTGDESQGTNGWVQLGSLPD